MPDKDQLASWLAAETGLPLTATSGLDANGDHWIRLTPQDVSARHAFSVRLTMAWRRLTITFEPGNFARGLLENMAHADADGRSLFRSTLHSARLTGAEIILRIDGTDQPYDGEGFWGAPWKRMHLELRKANVMLGDSDDEDDAILRHWSAPFMAALIAILPIEDDREDETITDHQAGFPEGAARQVLVNRYERDRRNRAAAIAIHGLSCRACGMNFAERYGPVAAGYIEVHHTVPVSRLGACYVVDPQTDLTPLCSNCHSVAHRQDPPIPADEIRKMMRHTKG